MIKRQTEGSHFRSIGSIHSSGMLKKIGKLCRKQTETFISLCICEAMKVTDCFVNENSTQCTLYMALDWTPQFNCQFMLEIILLQSMAIQIIYICLMYDVPSMKYMFRSSIDSNLQTQYLNEKETILLSRLI